jgi:hypothetical protein
MRLSQVVSRTRVVHFGCQAHWAWQLPRRLAHNMPHACNIFMSTPCVFDALADRSPLEVMHASHELATPPL